MHDVLAWLRLTFDRRATQFPLRHEALVTVDDLVLFFSDYEVMEKGSNGDSGGGSGGGGGGVAVEGSGDGGDFGEPDDGETESVLTVESLHALLWNIFFLPHGGNATGAPLNPITMANPNPN